MLGPHSIYCIATLCVVAAFATESADTAAYCKLLASKIPKTVSYPGSTTYNSSVTSYYSGQESQLQPPCIFSPSSADEVSQFIKIINPRYGYEGGPKFAVRSGGHMQWTGAANIQGGITVDMRSMNSIELSANNKAVSLGAGGI